MDDTDNPGNEGGKGAGGTEPDTGSNPWAAPTADRAQVPPDSPQWMPPPPAAWQQPPSPQHWQPPQGHGMWQQQPPPPPQPTGWGYGHPGQGAGPGGPWGWGPGGPGAPVQPGGGWANPWVPPGRPPRPRQSLPAAVIALLLAVAVLVGLGIGHGVWKSSSSVTPATTPGNAVNPFGNGSGSSSSANASAIASKASGALVDINTSLSYQHGQAAGTGIVLTPDGFVLTNNHVISGATAISATDVGNGQKYTADVVGYDRTHDIAVIKLRDASGLQTAAIANSDRVSVGDYVIGLGNAGGVGGAPSSAEGTVTGLNQSITASDESNGTSEQLTGLIQTNANIQPGDSGGALVNKSGQVIGVDTAASAGFSFQTQGNQGFAVPINQAMSIANQIRNGQASSTVHIGATAFIGVLVNANSGGTGATLSGVVTGGPAAQAGLQAGDTIVSLGGKSIDSANALTSLMGQYHPGDRVSISWTDSAGQSHQATIQLTTGPAA